MTNAFVLMHVVSAYNEAIFLLSSNSKKWVGGGGENQVRIWIVYEVKWYDAMSSGVK